MACNPGDYISMLTPQDEVVELGLLRGLVSMADKAGFSNSAVLGAERVDTLPARTRLVITEV